MQQATKAMFNLYKRINNLNLPVSLIFKLFDNTVLSIFIFSAETRGYEDNKILEKLHCSFIGKVLQLKQITPNYMLLLLLMIVLFTLFAHAIVLMYLHFMNLSHLKLCLSVWLDKINLGNINVCNNAGLAFAAYLIIYAGYQNT